MVERPPPPDLPTRPQYPPMWRSIKRPTLVAILAAGLLVYEAVFDPGPVDRDLVILYGWFLMAPGPVAGFELYRRYVLDREENKK